MNKRNTDIDSLNSFLCSTEHAIILMPSRWVASLSPTQASSAAAAARRRNRYSCFAGHVGGSVEGPALGPEGDAEARYRRAYEARLNPFNGTFPLGSRRDVHKSKSQGSSCALGRQPWTRSNFSAHLAGSSYQISVFPHVLVFLLLSHYTGRGSQARRALLHMWMWVKL